MAESDIKLELLKEVAIVTLNRPDKANALTTQMIVDLTSLFQQLGTRDDVRVIILTGAGRTFCSGADLSMMRAAATQDFAKNLAGAEAIFDLMYGVYSCPKPVLGRVNGAAIGGGLGLVSCCDIAIAVERAVFSLSEVRLGLVPAIISPFVLAKVGTGRGRELFLTGERFDAYGAQELDLVHHVVAEDDLDSKTEERLSELLQAAPGAQSDIKELIRFVEHSTVESSRGYTTNLIARRRESDEGQEGIAAFLEKRAPNWQR